MHAIEIPANSPSGHRGRRRARGPVRVSAALAALATLAASLLLAACGGSDGDGEGGAAPAATASTAGADQVLGALNPAKGTPVRIGMISDGKGSVTDLSFEGPVADTTVAYLNARKGGIGGHPIELVKCDALADPAKGTDCANQMVEKNVTAVVVGSSSVVESMWEPLHQAHIPVLFGGANAASILTDKDSTFVLADALFSLVSLPIQLAKDKKVDTVSVVAIDVPAVMSIYQTVAPAAFKAAGIKLDLVPVPPGTADMTPQMQRIATAGPRVVQMIGSDSFCIAGLNGLHSVGFTGPVVAISQCVTDALRKAVPGSVLKGVTVSATAPVGTDNPSTRLFSAIVDTYGKGKNIQVNRQGSLSMFTVVAALQTATEGISGDITPASITAAIKSMPEKDLPGADPMKFRCGGKAAPATPAVCVRGGLVTSLDEKGQPTEFRAVASTPIEG
ncbi:MULTISPECIES: ABC transporter substrate-binding protein [Pseudofrankia]|uniref:ABC transporter substrate-binding protein n=1 Tax=Pseudofrankia TaxID=2994363 RepID=UPI000234C777|nr:branched-chain amino acid ABC transporter substrate-binding protein [Pseudofrankia sp. EUN1h]